MNYYRLYSCPRKQCIDCPKIHDCEIDCGSIRICASGNYPAFHRNKLKYQSAEYFRVMRLRKIWSEGTFAVLDSSSRGGMPLCCYGIKPKADGKGNLN